MVIHLLFNSLGDWRARAGAGMVDRKCSPVRLFSPRNAAPVCRSGAVVLLLRGVIPPNPLSRRPRHRLHWFFGGRMRRHSPRPRMERPNQPTRVQDRMSDSRRERGREEDESGKRRRAGTDGRTGPPGERRLVGLPGGPLSLPRWLGGWKWALERDHNAQFTLFSRTVRPRELEREGESRSRLPAWIPSCRRAPCSGMHSPLHARIEQSKVGCRGGGAVVPVRRDFRQ